MLNGERPIGQSFPMAVTASVHGEQKRECPQGTSATPEGGPAGTPRRCLWHPVEAMTPTGFVPRQHGRRHGLILQVAAHQYA